MAVKPRLQPGRAIRTRLVSVPFRFKDEFLAGLCYTPIWHLETRQWEVDARDEALIRKWLDAKMPPPDWARPPANQPHAMVRA
ncbi:hypothetical protein [Tabrizicola soli]|uniref:Uncharacterized protein n=1 Tax=Tabrizicola soli TaxID=2185115 RepID=A0ABV7E1R4_9RHOB|nr:hypothetical protein [Tabrizicola soli]